MLQLTRKRNGVRPGIHTGSAAYAKRMIEMGFQFVPQAMPNGKVAPNLAKRGILGYRYLEPTVYCLPGRTGHVVITSAALAALDGAAVGPGRRRCPPRRVRAGS